MAAFAVVVRLRDRPAGVDLRLRLLVVDFVVMALLSPSPILCNLGLLFTISGQCTATAAPFPVDAPV
ncbi:hypothetical protein GCM10023209_36270 [Roseibacterium beibuensis]|uniref:Uncharacterized protein n=1 Tax=[Roseibacterium] beibuensis TaxID=1193142 RepID=A0ABP9LMC6_9RHOB